MLLPLLLQLLLLLLRWLTRTQQPPGGLAAAGALHTHTPPAFLPPTPTHPTYPPTPPSLLQVVYENNGTWPGRRSVDLLLDEALFRPEHGGLAGALAVGGADPRRAAVLLAGVPGELAAALTRRLTHAGVSSERILVCDYF